MASSRLLEMKYLTGQPWWRIGRPNGGAVRSQACELAACQDRRSVIRAGFSSQEAVMPPDGCSRAGLLRRYPQRYRFPLGLLLLHTAEQSDRWCVARAQDR